ncbi:unnamed protein product [Mytilus coruscus]|uniref:WFDC3 n=1 Tax=Mytilus coruscus TaxID=42192 RepID=A0A6J8EC29_MYTCO|nr:unnamed protein product [Mytilus coruscus]
MFIRKVNPKPGTCPVLPPDTVGTCATECGVDSDCPGVKKCCSNNCAHVCLFPKPEFCPTCCGPPPCCSTCITCEIGEPQPNVYCNSSNQLVCAKSFYCKIFSPDEDFGVCCKGNRKPGRCPVVLPESIGPCIDLPVCNVDSDCHGVQKCCPNGCGHECLFPVTVKPGTCPTLPPDTAGTCVDLCSVDSDCLGDQKCCSHGCGHSCSSPVSSCPPVPKCPIPPRGPPGTCKPPCIFEYMVINGLRCRVKCFRGPQGPRGPLCPPTGCPGVGQPEQAAQQDSTGAILEERSKPGTCPVFPPGSGGTCVEKCRTDSDCPWILKSCSSGCGHICHIPANTDTYGFVLDENNCPICECKTGCYGNAEPLFPSVNCAKGPRCPSSYHCVTTSEGTFGVCCPIDCPQLLCLKPCPHGFKVDENDCQTCECLQACPKAICPRSCEYGFKYDSIGCQTCGCKSRSCPARLCPWSCPEGYKLGCQTCDCRRASTVFRGPSPPPGRPGDPCPPTGCRGKPTRTAVQQDIPRHPPGPPPGKRRCPVDSGSNANCYGHYHRYCKDDSSCPNKIKCCKQDAPTNV